MKKMIAFLALTALIAGTAHAQVYSNIVGMVKVTASSGENTYVASNFIVEGGTTTVEQLFGTSLPELSRIFFWNSATGAYETATYGSRGWSNGDIVIERSKGFIVNIPAEDPQQNYVVVLSGGVPTSDEEATVTTVLEAGLTLTAFPYPVSKNISAAGFSPDPLDQIFIWNGVSWSSSTYGTRGGWTPDLTIEPGTSFFYKKALNAQANWDVTNPVSSN